MDRGVVGGGAKEDGAKLTVGTVDVDAQDDAGGSELSPG